MQIAVSNFNDKFILVQGERPGLFRSSDKGILRERFMAQLTVKITPLFVSIFVKRTVKESEGSRV